MKSKIIKIINSILPFIIMSFFISMCIFTLYMQEEVKILKEQINIKDRQILRYEERDSMIRVYMGADSSGVFTYRLIDGNIVSYRELMQETDSFSKENRKLKKRINNLSDTLWVKNAVIRILKKAYNFTYDVSKKNDSIEVSVEYEITK